MPKRKKRDQDGLFERPDSPYWWASFTDSSGRPTRRSTGVRRDQDPDQAQAQAIRAQWVLEASLERRHGPAVMPETHTFDELMLLYLQGPSRDKRSTERDTYSAKQLYPVFTGQVLETLNGSAIRHYIAGRQQDGVSNSTINKELGLFSAALNWARRELEWDIPNPAQGRRLKEPPGRNRWLTQTEGEALLDAAQQMKRSPYLIDFIRLGLNAGMRPGEILQLEWSRIDLNQHLIYLDITDQKNGKLGSIPLNQEALAAIQSRAQFHAKHCPQSPWVFCNRRGERIANIKRSFANAVARAGLENVHPHDLRRTCGSWLVQAGVSIQAVSKLLRHSDIRVTDQIYAHLAPTTVRAAVDVLNVSAVSRSGFTLAETDLREVR